jgi:hypothetical protein
MTQINEKYGYTQEGNTFFPEYYANGYWHRFATEIPGEHKSYTSKGWCLRFLQHEMQNEMEAELTIWMRGLALTLQNVKSAKYCMDCAFLIQEGDLHPVSDETVWYCKRCGDKRTEGLVQCEQCREWVGTIHWGVCQDCYYEENGEPRHTPVQARCGRCRQMVEQYVIEDDEILCGQCIQQLAESQRIFSQLRAGITVHVKTERGVHFAIRPEKWEGLVLGYTVIQDGKIVPGYKGKMISIEELLNFCAMLRLDTADTVILTHTHPLMSDARYYYHVGCWDASDQRLEDERREGDELASRSLSSEPWALRDGNIRLVARSEVPLNTYCMECGKTIHNADTIL